MMTLRLQSQSLFCVAALLSFLLFATRLQSCTSLPHPQRSDDAGMCRNKDSYYSSTYATIDSGLKVMDALKAQTSFIRSGHIQVSETLIPQEIIIISNKVYAI